MKSADYSLSVRVACLMTLSVLGFCGNGAASSLVWQVAAHEDDASASSGSIAFRQSIIYTPYSNLARLAFWRWRINIPRGVTVESAYLHLQSYQQVGSSPSTMQLSLVDKDDCPPLDTLDTYDLPITMDSVLWIVPGDWRPDGGEDGSGWYRSIDIAPLLQAFIDRPGYAPGSYLGLRGSHVAGGAKLAWQFTESVPNRGARLEATVSGGDVLLYVHMADPEVRFAQKIFCEIVNPAATDSLVAHLNGEEVFRKENGLTSEEVFTLSYAEHPAGDYELSVQIVGADGLPRASFLRRWTKLHDGIGIGSIDENNALRLNGELFFPLHSWMLRSDLFDSPIGTVINTLRCAGYASEHTPQTFGTYLNRAAVRELPVVGPERWDPKGDIPISDFVQYNREHPALFGWAWKDEPDLGSNPIPVTEVRRWTDICRSNDTRRPVWVNFSPDAMARPDGSFHTERGKSYCYEFNADAFGGRKTPVADVVGLDLYPYEFATKFDWLNIDMLATGIRRLRDWNRDLLPVVVFIESQDLVAESSPGLQYPWTPGPTPAQLKNLIWICIVNGAKGIGYFHYFTPTPEENIDVLREAKEQIAELTPVILSPERHELVSALIDGSGRVDYTARAIGQTNYVFAVNMRDTVQPVEFAVPGMLADTAVTVLYESRSIASTGSRFTDTLEPFGVGIYKWTDPTGLRPLPPTNLRLATP